ncbi:helix-turn-helix DNA-binding protein [Gordonia phage Keelan]|nr:helix-turn-helix DNA-binding protein [Gordonia phage Keelan]
MKRKTEKACRRCGVVKPIDEYHRNGKYIRNDCRPCTNLAKQERVKRIRETTQKNKDAERQAFIEDYEFLTEQGLSHEEIANSLGIQVASLTRRCDRAGLAVALNREQKIIKRQYDAMVKRGNTFSYNNIGLVELGSKELAFWRKLTEAGINAGEIKHIGEEPSFGDKNNTTMAKVFVRADV